MPKSQPKSIRRFVQSPFTLTRARVTRTATVTLPEGASVLFVGLPEGLDMDSVVAHAQSDATLTIQGIYIRNQFLPSSALPRTQELHGQLLHLEDAQKSFSATKHVLEEKRAFFRNFAVSPLVHSSHFKAFSNSSRR
jgi:N-terminal domain of unknown function (DUF4140)